MLSVGLITLFSLFDTIDVYFHSFRRYFGVEIGHLQMAIYTSRREEMINVVRSTLFYMNANEPVPVHSLSALSSPYQVILIYFQISYILRFVSGSFYFGMLVFKWSLLFCRVSGVSQDSVIMIKN